MDIGQLDAPKRAKITFAAGIQLSNSSIIQSDQYAKVAISDGWVHIFEESKLQTDGVLSVPARSIQWIEWDPNQ